MSAKFGTPIQHFSQQVFIFQNVNNKTVVLFFYGCYTELLFDILFAIQQGTSVTGGIMISVYTHYLSHHNFEFISSKLCFNDVDFPSNSSRVRPPTSHAHKVLHSCDCAEQTSKTNQLIILINRTLAHRHCYFDF